MGLITVGMIALYTMRSRPQFLAAAGFVACCTAFIILETGVLADFLAGNGVSRVGLALHPRDTLFVTIDGATAGGLDTHDDHVTGRRDESTRDP